MLTMVLIVSAYERSSVVIYRAQIKYHDVETGFGVFDSISLRHDVQRSSPVYAIPYLHDLGYYKITRSISSSTQHAFRAFRGACWVELGSIFAWS